MARTPYQDPLAESTFNQNDVSARDLEGTDRYQDTAGIPLGGVNKMDKQIHDMLKSIDYTKQKYK